MEKDVKDDIDDEVMTDGHYFMYLCGQTEQCVFLATWGQQSQTACYHQILLNIVSNQ